MLLWLQGLRVLGKPLDWVNCGIFANIDNYPPKTRECCLVTSIAVNYHIDRIDQHVANQFRLGAIVKILLASPRGFCAGVNMAIESLDLTLREFGSPVYVYHEIVHNRYVVESFKKKGAVFVDTLEEVPRDSVLMFSAHGVSPEIRELAKSRNLNAIDATCPLVTKVHLEAVKYAREGYTIFLIGHDGHDEVIGTMGEAPEAMILVETVEDVAKLEVPDDAKVAYLTQTTLSVDDANKIIAKLRERYKNLVNPPKDDICYATQNRQEAVRTICKNSDLCLVLGSQNSSNSQRLRQLADESGVPAYLIDGAEDMKEEWLEGVETILVTAGASAPETVVEETIAWIEERHDTEVEPVMVREENVNFPLPKKLRQLIESK